MSKSKRKLLLVTVLWFFFLLSLPDLPFKVLVWISLGIGAMTAAILAL